MQWLLYVLATPLCQTCLKTLWYTLKLWLCFYSVKNDTSINPLFHLAQMAAILDFIHNAMSKVLSDYITMPGISETDERWANIIFFPSDIHNILINLDVNKATGPDKIGNFLLKNVADSISEPLCKFFNYSMQNSTFPSMWKKNNVILIQKKMTQKINKTTDLYFYYATCLKFLKDWFTIKFILF